jgi:GH25 family lysozyme M1 (1,4-beta-N-acetylmuramidase)
MAVVAAIGIAGMAGAGQAMASNGPGGGTNYATPAYTGYLKAHAPADHMGRSLRARSAGSVAKAEVPRLPAAAADPYYGVDVSSYQGNVNWSQVAANGGTFAYVKATEGTYYTNPYFGQQYNGSSNAGLIRGAYAFAIPSYSSGASQADYFASNGGAWYADAHTLPGALDIEYNPYGPECYGLSQSAMVSWISGFLYEYHARTGRWAVIYSTTDWWTTCTGNYGGFHYGDPLWIARYASSPGTLPAGWSGYTFWQYADSGSSPGDQDVFNGSLNSLETTVAADSGTPPGGAVQGYYSLCLDNFRQSTANGNKIDLFTCNGSVAQHWTMEAAPASNGRYTGWLENSNGKCLNDAGYGGVGSQVILWDCVNTANETWTYWPLYREYSVSYGGHTYCLDDPGYSITPGVPQNVWTCPDTVNEWYALPH